MTAGTGGMNRNLMTLLEIQDLRSKKAELQDEGELESLEQEHFNIDPEEAVAQLEERLESLRDELDPGVQRRFDRVRNNLERVVVPVINGVCYGCFVSVATAVTGEQAPNELVQNCESCGRFLYFLS